MNDFLSGVFGAVREIAWIAIGFVATFAGIGAAFAADANDAFPRVQLLPEPHDAVSFQYDGHEILRYHYGADAPRPYFYPVIGPAGRPVTRISHPHDPFSHRHHLSLWVGHQSVDGVNFWEISKDSGRIVYDKIVKIDDGKLSLLDS